MCLIKHIQNGGRNQNARKSLGAQRNPPVTWKVGRREYPALAKIMHKKKAFMARNCGISLSGRLWRQRRRQLQDTNSHWWAPLEATKTNALRREMPQQRRSRLSSTKWTRFCRTSYVVAVWCCIILRQLQLHEREAEHEHEAALLSALVVRCERVDQLTIFN